MLFIAIPVHNEVETIGVLLWRLRSVLAEFPREYEVVVYDDASTDGTHELLEGYAKVLPLTVLRGERQVGYALALDHLLRHAVTQTRHPRRDAVLLLQGDFTDPPGLIPEFARRFEGGADLVVGERTTLADAPVAVQRLFRFAGWSMRPFVRIEGLQDVTSSLRLVRIAAVRDLLRERGDAPLVEGDSWTANADLLLRLIPFARRVETVPVQSTYGVRLRETRRVATRDAMAALKWAWAARKRRVKVLIGDGEPSRARDESRPLPARTETDERGMRPRSRHVDEDQAARDRALDSDDERTSRRARRPRDGRGTRARGTDDGAERVSARERGERTLNRDRQRQDTSSPALVDVTADREETDDEDAVHDDVTGAASTERKRKRRKRSAKRPLVVDTAAETLALVDPAAGSAPDLELLDDIADVSDDDADAAQRPRRKKRRRRKRSRDVNSESVQNDDGATDDESRDRDVSDIDDHPYRDEPPGESNATDDGPDAHMNDDSGEDTDASLARRRGRRGRRGGRRSRRNRDGERLGGDGSGGEGPGGDVSAGDGSSGHTPAGDTPTTDRANASNGGNPSNE